MEQRDHKKDSRSAKGVRKYLHGDQPMPKNSARQQKLADAILSKKDNYWQKYLEKEDSSTYLGLTDKKALPEKRVTRAREEHKRKERDRKKEEEELGGKKGEQGGFRVTGEIEMDDVVEIVRVFIYKDSRVMQLRLRNGKMTNMLEEDIRQHKPQMFL